MPYLEQIEEQTSTLTQVQQSERHDFTEEADNDDFTITPQTNQVSFDFIT